MSGISMNDQLRDIFFQLLRIGLWGKGTLTLTQPLTLKDWTLIHKYAINHTVDAIIYDSFANLKDCQLPPQSLLIKWAVRVDVIERRNDKMNKIIAEQFKFFKSEGVQSILQKGQGIAACYRIPSHRISGDIDWWFNEDGYEVIRNVLKKRGIDFWDTDGFSLNYKWEGIHIEHHKELFDIFSPFKKNFLKRIQKNYKTKAQILEINNSKINLLAIELQILHVNAHILKHLLSFGIGLRQLCDSARLYFSTYQQYDSASLYKIYKNAGILKWVHVLHKLLVNFIGLPLERLPFPFPDQLDEKWMLDEIWFSGDFGFHDERFQDEKSSMLSQRPQGVWRIWLNFKRYIKYAPEEVLFYPLVHIYSKLSRKRSIR
ncbi:nucleotidyltransferase family protein [Sphingobacterium thalpophilum]|uniref:nucleotidyltransferase family protein n=1 Tax=Sphingobacterium thalpophilum TaxID=259 RepID=UPI0037DA3437